MNTIGNQTSELMGAYVSTRGSSASKAAYLKRTTGKKIKKKQLNYNHREISSQILRASKARTASSVLATAKSKLSSLKRCQGTGQYNESELRAAIIHARRMVQCASKKVQNLKEEELVKGKLEREQGMEELKRKAEVRQRAARKEQQLKQKLVIEEMEQNRKLEKEWQELVRKQHQNRSRERGKVNEADMKYIKSKIESMREQGYSSDCSEIARLQASLKEISRQELALQPGQPLSEAGSAAAVTTEAAGAASVDSAAASIGATVDICL